MANFRSTLDDFIYFRQLFVSFGEISAHFSIRWATSSTNYVNYGLYSTNRSCNAHCNSKVKYLVPKGATQWAQGLSQGEPKIKYPTQKTVRTVKICFRVSLSTSLHHLRHIRNAQETHHEARNREANAHRYYVLVLEDWADQERTKRKDKETCD
jgi:hypothetical protein